MQKKITVIGGGSTQWMRVLMKDIYMIEELDGGEICLVDPKTEYVEGVAAMLEYFNQAQDKKFNITIKKDLYKACRNADFVITTFSPGSMDSFVNDLEIPIKYGIRLPVSMTVGVCGISAAIRTAPVAYELVEVMEQVCPGAWLLNVTNPMSVVTRAMHMAARKTKVVGLCHEFHSLYKIMKPIFDLSAPEDMPVLEKIYSWLPEQGFEYTVAGINHFTWLTGLKYKNKNMLPKVRDYAKAYDKTQEHGAKMSLCENFGYLPLPGDRHLIEFLPSLCNIQNGWGMKYGVKKTTIDERIYGMENSVREIKDIAAGNEPENLWQRSAEELPAIMEAIVCDKSVTGMVNMPNAGQIDNLPKDITVETLAEINQDGITCKKSGELPRPIATLCRFHSDIHEMTVEASLKGDRKLLLDAMLLDPSTAHADFSSISTMCNELLESNKKWLPRFF
jgi:alpha-galactosidase/6-phospho-beta-glucosidase family protein